MKAFQILLLTAMVTIAMKKCVAEYLLVEIEDAERRGSMLNARKTSECTKWGEWGQCSESCGNGFMERVCINTAGQSGKESGLPNETKRCQIRNNNCEESCDDKILNQDEEKIDCGGSCPACPETCDDNILNQDEENIDCGGSCPACPVDCKWGEFTCSGSKDAFCDKSGWRTCTRSKITEAENGGKDCEELNDNIKQECQVCTSGADCPNDFPYCINDYCEDLDDGTSR